MKNLLDKNFLIKLFISFIFFLLAIISTNIGSNYIKKTFVEPPIVRDLLWEKLPYISWFIIISEIIIAFSVIYLIYWSIKKDKDYIPYVFIMWFSFQIIRAIMIIFTPLGFPQMYDGIVPIGKESTFAFGNYPSGHLIYPFLLFLVTRKKLFILLSFLGGLTLLISHGHYTVDLIGTVFIGFALYSFFKKYVKKYLIGESITIHTN